MMQEEIKGLSALNNALLGYGGPKELLSLYKKAKWCNTFNGRVVFWYNKSLNSFYQGGGP